MSESDNNSGRIQRQVLPIPDQPYAGFVTYDAKDPDSKLVIEADIQEEVDHLISHEHLLHILLTHQ